LIKVFILILTYVKAGALGDTFLYDNKLYFPTPGTSFFNLSYGS